MRFDITHQTSYRYERPSSHVVQLLRLTPQQHAGQITHRWHIDTPGKLQAQTDGFGNICHLLTLTEPRSDLIVRVSGEVEVMDDTRSCRFGTDDGLSPLLFTQPTHFTEANDAIHAIAAQHLTANAPATEAQALALMAAIRDAIDYISGSTVTTTTAIEAMAQGSGVCQDQSHVYLACCRAMGVPARYVSGYLNTGDPGHLATHAWIDIYTDQHQWLSIDITNDSLTDGRHCRLAIGRDYDSAAPVRGTRLGGGSEIMEAFVHVSAQSAAVQQ